MGSRRAKLTVAAEVAEIATAVALGSGWLYRHFDMPGAWPSWMGKVNWLIVPLALSFTGNVLFSIVTRMREKAIPAKVHAGRVDGELAALFRHYSAISTHLANRLETTAQHFLESGDVLSRPLDKAMSIKNVRGAHSREHDIFTIVYTDHIGWMAWEIPEFGNDLPAFGSNIEYLDLVKLLKAHAKLLGDAAKEIDAQA
jgi:hypothetical protein